MVETIEVKTEHEIKLLEDRSDWAMARRDRNMAGKRLTSKRVRRANYWNRVSNNYLFRCLYRLNRDLERNQSR